MFWTLVFAAVRCLLKVAIVFYAGLVLIALKCKEPPQLKFNWNEPARSGERILMWAGALTVGFIWRELKAVLDILEDASADIGEWVFHRGTRG